MIDFSKYTELKNKGALLIQKVGDSRAMIIKRQFNAEHGGETDPQVGHIQPDDLLKTREQLQATIQGLDTFLSDLEAMGIKATGKK